MPRSSNPVPQYFTAKNKILVGGLMFYFETESSTPKVTYSDQQETIPNTHPVVLDSEGRLPNVFFTGTAKQVLEDANSVQIWERDNVGDNDTPNFNDADLQFFSTTQNMIDTFSKTPTINDIVETLGFTVEGDGGGAQWRFLGVTGQTPSQTPTQLVDNLLNDFNGNQWALVVGQVSDYNGIQWYPLPFGDSGTGGYLFDDNGWGKIDTGIINDLSQAYIFPTLNDAINSTIAFPTGKALHITESDSSWDVSPIGTFPVSGTIFNVFDSNSQNWQIKLRENEIGQADKMKSIGFLIPNPSDDWLFLDKAMKAVAEQQEVAGQADLRMLDDIPFAGYNMLDLNGRTLTLDRPLVLPVSSGFGLVNGCITCTDDYTMDDFLIVTGSGTGDFDLHKFMMSNILFHGKRRANLVQLDKFLDVHMLNCHGYAYNSIGINPIGGNSSHELYVIGGKYEKNTFQDNQAALDNSGTCFDVQAYDCEFKPAFVGGCAEAFIFARGEKSQYCSIEGVHMATGIDMEIGVEMFQDSSVGLTLINNYFDGCKIKALNGTGLQIKGNKFLNSPVSRPSDNFIELAPSVASQTISGLQITGNDFRSNGELFNAIELDETGAGVNFSGAVVNGTRIKDNSRNGNVTLRELEVEANQFLNNNTTSVYDFSDSLLFTPNFIQVSARNTGVAGVNPGVEAVVNGTTVTATCSAAITGSLDIVAKRIG